MAIETILGAQSSAYVNKFETEVREALQRTDSGLMAIARPGELSGDKQYFSVSGPVSFTQRQGRYAPKTYTNTSWERRFRQAKVYFCGMAIDGTDERRLQTQLSPSFGNKITNAWKRLRDDLIFSAITDPVQVQQDSAEGVETFVTKTLITENTILANDHDLDDEGGTGNTPLTHYKISKAVALLQKWNALTEETAEMPVVIGSTEQLRRLAASKGFINRDYSNIPLAQQKGILNDLQGFQNCRYVAYNPEVKANDGTFDNVYVVVPGAVEYAEPTPFSLTARQDENLIMDPTCIDGTVEFGCVRTVERMVVEIKCTAINF
jgi:hypothetical protein